MRATRGTMKAVLLTGHGGFERLGFRDDVRHPVAGRNEDVIEYELLALTIPTSTRQSVGIRRLSGLPQWLGSRRKRFHHGRPLIEVTPLTRVIRRIRSRPTGTAPVVVGRHCRFR
jgi:hypothetical protein